MLLFNCFDVLFLPGHLFVERMALDQQRTQLAKIIESGLVQTCPGRQIFLENFLSPEITSCLLRN